MDRERQFDLLCRIVRAQHFAWRRAVAELCPTVDPSDVVRRMWAVTGAQTAEAYKKRIDPRLPLAAQVAEGIASSSRAMGEDVEVEAGAVPGEVFVRHSACPWLEFHRREGVLEEDRSGCDAWFQATVEGINGDLGSRLRVQTLQSLPEGAPSCLRRLWVED